MRHRAAANLFSAPAAAAAAALPALPRPVLVAKLPGTIFVDLDVPKRRSTRATKTRRTRKINKQQTTCKLLFIKMVLHMPKLCACFTSSRKTCRGPSPCAARILPNCGASGMLLPFILCLCLRLPLPLFNYIYVAAAGVGVVVAVAVFKHSRSITLLLFSVVFVLVRQQRPSSWGIFECTSASPGWIRPEPIPRTSSCAETSLQCWEP